MKKTNFTKKTKNNTQTLVFLAEMPVTNGLIQAQLVPVVKACSKRYKTVLVETRGRFEGQLEFRRSFVKELEDLGTEVCSIKVKKETFWPSIFYFFLETKKILKEILKTKTKNQNQFLIYARNYKFTPILIWFYYFFKIKFIYSPRGAYVAERRYYKSLKGKLYGIFIQFFEKKAIRLSQKTIVETRYFKEHLIKAYGLENFKDKLEVIPNYFDAKKLPKKSWDRKKMRQKLGFSGKKVIVYAGTLEIWYDFQKMFELIGFLRKQEKTIFFQLFLKKDFARKESKDMYQQLFNYAKKNGLQEKVDFAISSFPSSERYKYLSACDAGICLTTRAEFKVIMFYLKLLDYLACRLPFIVNDDVLEAKNLIKKHQIGALVDYDNWQASIKKLNLKALLNKKENYNFSLEKKYSSRYVIKQYLNLFKKNF
jgi:hypothetical protein